jgi:tetratricopeptide (TPR) repeat protein
LVLGLATGFAGESAWQAYNAGVQAYATGDYTNAFQKWQDLSIAQVPRALRRPVWFQLGNAQFRMGEPLEENSPEETVELWRRSCDAYRTVLLEKPRDAEARHNLDVVLRRLARLTHRLGMEAFRASEDKPIDDAIDLLKTSTEHLEEAASLTPEDRQISSDRDKARQALRDRLQERAGTAEQKGDESTRQNSPWADQQAEEQYRAALEDLAEARRPAASSQPEKGAESRPDETDETVAKSEERVQQKLAELLTRRGQREQQMGDQQAKSNTDQALNQYESALADFQAAQEVKPEHAPAQNGEREVRKAMENLHTRAGREELKRGKDALAQQNPRAEPALNTALSHFESAMELNEENAEARAGAEEARRLLPEALNLAGKNELNAGDRAEPQSATQALNHYQEAEQDFRQSLELKPGQQPAEKGLREAEGKMARARERAAKEAEAAALAGQPQIPPPLPLSSLLGRVGEKQRLPDTERQRQPGQKNTGPGKNHADW